MVCRDGLSVDTDFRQQGHIGLDDDTSEKRIRELISPAFATVFR